MERPLSFFVLCMFTCQLTAQNINTPNCFSGSTSDLQNMPFTMGPCDYGYNETTGEFKFGDGVHGWDDLAPMIYPPEVFVDGAKLDHPKILHTSATTSGSTVTFNLTEDNTPTGEALFTSVAKASMRVWIDDEEISMQVGDYTVSGNNKTLTITVQRPDTSTLLGVVVLRSELANLPNGTTVYLSIEGN